MIHRILLLTAIVFSAIASAASEPEDVTLFVTIGQSNADGSAFSDPAIDRDMWQWYTNSPAARNLHIWYYPSQIANVTDFRGQSARHVVPARFHDMPAGWMDLWYRNDNVARHTAMNMIHGAGTYSAAAQGRRGMEGQFGRRWAEAFPDRQLYMIKLGASGSGIDTWANPADDNNWRYFIDSVYTPAVNSLLARGKRPRLAGIWWMQGCADKAADSASYDRRLRELVGRLRQNTGFPDARIFIGAIPAPGESEVNPRGSSGYGEGVRKAQLAVSRSIDGVSFVPTADCSMQVEDLFPHPVHFDHRGINAIGDRLADSVIAAGLNARSRFTTPGRWTIAPEGTVFTPSVGHPEVTYRTTPTESTARLQYPGWSEELLIPISRAVPAESRAVAGEGEWELVWQDDFSGNTFDPAVWSKIPRGRANWNDCMSSADSLYAVADGNLILRGVRTWPELADTAACVTGGLYTKGKMAFGYGRLEIRARLEGSKGQWPAIWLLPAPVDGKDTPWPYGGEIDIMERLNFDDFVYQTVHSRYTLEYKHDNEPPHFATGKIRPDDYNVYAVEMYPDSLRFYVNDVHTFTYPRIATDNPSQYPFDRPYYLLVDMQLGGSWVGPVDLDQLPVAMYVDRVSFYRRR